MRKVDINGQIFGKLTVKEFVQINNNGKAVWRCQCSCGNFKDVISGNLIQNRTMSCGICVKTPDLLGKKFGNMTVVDKLGLVPTKSGKNIFVWIVQDERGFRKMMRTGEILLGKRLDRSSPLNDHDSAILALQRKYKHGAKKRGHSFELNYLEFKTLIAGKCEYCGIKPTTQIASRINENYKLSYNGIDRKNNKEGYILENCVSCCKICNKAKSDLDYSTWISYIKRIAVFQTGASNNG